MPSKLIKISEKQGPAENLIDAGDDFRAMDEVLHTAINAIAPELEHQYSHTTTAEDAEGDSGDAIELTDADIIVDSSLSTPTQRPSKAPPFTKTLWRKKIESLLGRKASERNSAPPTPLHRDRSNTPSTGIRDETSALFSVIDLARDRGDSSMRRYRTDDAIADALMDIRNLTRVAAEDPRDADDRETAVKEFAATTETLSPLKPVPKLSPWAGPLKMGAVVLISILTGAGLYKAIWGTSTSNERSPEDMRKAALDAEYTRLKQHLKGTDPDAIEKLNAELTATKAELEALRTEREADVSTADKIQASLDESFGKPSTLSGLAETAAMIPNHSLVKRGNTPVSPAESASAKDNAIAVREQLSEAELTAGLTAVAPEVKACGNGRTAEVVVVVTVNRNGKISRAVPVGYAFTPIGFCIAKAVMRARFPTALKASTIRFPFSF